MVLPALPLLAKILAGTAAAGAGVGAVRAATGSQLEKDTSRDDDPSLNRPRSAFGEVMDYLGQTSQPVLNLFGGRFGAAGRQLLDVLLKPVDAVLPGDVIPDFAKPSDYTSASELVTDAYGGKPEDLPFLARFPLDVAGDIVTSPASLLSFGGASGATRVAKGLGEARKLGEAGKQAAIEAAEAATKSGRVLTDAERAAQISAAGQMAARKALPTELEAALSRSARKELAASGGSQAYVADLIRKTGGDPNRVLAEIGRGGAQEGRFIQGGTRFAGKELLREGAVAGAVDNLVKAVGQFSSKAEEIIRTVGNVTQRAGQAVKRATGNLKLAPGLRSLFDRARTEGSNVTRAVTDATEGLLASVPAADREFISSAFFNVGKRDGAWQVLTDKVPAQAFMTVDDQVRLLMDRAADLRSLGLKTELSPAQLEATFRGMAELNRTMFDEAVRKGIMSAPAGIDTAVMAPPAYMQRIMQAPEGQISEYLEKFAAAKPNFAKARKLREDADLATFLNDKGVSLKTDPLEIMVRRAGSQGRAVTKANITQEILGGPVDLGVQTSEIVNGALKILARDPETAGMAKALTDIVTGPGQRGAVGEVLAKFNRFWKPAVLYGLALPRFAAITRNRIGAINQELATAGASVGGLRRMAADLKGAVAEGINKGFGTKLGKDELNQSLDLIDDAFRAAGGDVRNIGQVLQRSGSPQAKRLAEAVEQGVLDGFIDTEALLSQWGRTARQQRFRDILDMPAAMFQNVEHRMRLGQFLGLRKQGVSPAEAGRIIKQAYLDYTTANTADRTIRDIIPFAAFLTRSVPQQLGMVAERGVIRQGASSLYTSKDRDTVLPPWVEDQASVDLGMRDAEGNPLVLAGLGLPIEVLDLLPGSVSPGDLGDAVRRNVVASSQPLLKEAFAQTSGRDPFFGTKVGSYDRSPRLLAALGITDEQGEAGRQIQNLRRIGLTAPAESVIGQSDVLLDDRQGLGTRLLRVLSGLRAVSIDEQRAVQQRLEEILARNPRVQSREILFDRSGDPETQRLLQALQATRQAIRQRDQP